MVFQKRYDQDGSARGHARGPGAGKDSPCPPRRAAGQAPRLQRVCVGAELRHRHAPACGGRRSFTTSSPVQVWSTTMA